MGGGGSGELKKEKLKYKYQNKNVLALIVSWGDTSDLWSWTNMC